MQSNAEAEERGKPITHLQRGASTSTLGSDEITNNLQGREVTYLPWATFFVVMYLLVGVSLYKMYGRKGPAGAEEEAWTFIDCVYFGVVTITTVGYGDLYPTTAPMKVATLIFVYIGVGAIAVSLRRLVDGLQIAHSKAQKVIMGKLLSKWNHSPRKVSTSRSHQTCLQKENLSEEDIEHLHRHALWCPSPVLQIYRQFPEGLQYHLDHYPNLINSFWPLAVFILVFAVLYGAVEDGREIWSTWQKVVDGFYLVSITVTSVGFGDLSPQSQGGRLLFICMIPFGIFTFTHCTAVFLMAEMEHKLKTQMCNPNSFRQMDLSKDGKLDETEFLQYMLVSMGRCDATFLKLVGETFKTIDRDGNGYIDEKSLAEYKRFSKREFKARVDERSAVSLEWLEAVKEGIDETVSRGVGGLVGGSEEGGGAANFPRRGGATAVMAHGRPDVSPEQLPGEMIKQKEMRVTKSVV
jgi:hypothetical protein